MTTSRPQSIFRKQKEKGDEAERLYGGFFRDQGWFVTKTADLPVPQDHEAELFGQKLSNYLPDVHVSKNGTARFKEVKAKSHPTLYDRMGREQHGFDRQPILGYLAIEREYGVPVDLCIYEEDSELQLCAPVAWLLSLVPQPPDGTSADWLGAREWRGGGKEMFYWDRDHFIRAEFYDPLRYDTTGVMDELFRRYLPPQ